MKFLKSLFGRKKSTPKHGARDDALYQKEKQIIIENDARKKQKLADSPKSHPEILFYLSTDEDVDIRRAVAKNLSTPIQASDAIARDEDEDVRLYLAHRLINLLPDIAEDKQSQVYAFTVNALGTLARDEVARIRVALSTALQDHAFAPPAVVKSLARDVERAVAEPIIKYCAALPDEDLLEILADYPDDWVVDAMTRRADLSADITEKLVDIMDEEGGVALLKNSSARLNETALSNVIDKSREHVSWQEPVSLRPELTYKLAQKLAGFCQDRVLNVLKHRSDLDDETALEIAEMVSRRVAFMSEDKPTETLEQKVNRFASTGRLTPETILDALAWREEGFVKLSLARVSGIHHLIIEKIFSSEAPKSITALAWYCGLPMRVAVELQKTLGRVPTKSLLYARAGKDYPLSEADMIWQLEFFGVDVNVSHIFDSEKKTSS